MARLTRPDRHLVALCEIAKRTLREPALLAMNDLRPLRPVQA